jgi:hypothetical protein
VHKRIIDAWRVLRGDMKAVPQGATVLYGCTFTDNRPYTLSATSTTTPIYWS